METNELPANWTDKQRAAYRMLMAQVVEQETKRAKARRMFEKAPNGGWTDEDRVK